MKRIFYGVDIVDPLRRGVFDLVRYIAEPDSFRFSHITLRGPTERRMSEREFARLNNQIKSWMVTVEGVGHFFLANQNTVFLSVDVGGLRTAWKKKNYPNGKAHITLYDGKSREFAKAIFNLASQYRWLFMMQTSKLKLLDSKVSLGTDVLYQLLDVEDAYKRVFPDSRLRLHQISSMPEEERLLMIGDIFEYLRLPASPAYGA